MAQVSININGRTYSVACGDGQEGRVRELAAELDSQVRQLAGEVGQIGDSLLLVLSGLSLIDRMGDMQSESVSQTDAASAGASAALERAKAAEARADAAERHAAGLERQLRDAIKRIDGLAEGLEEA
ncbi:MAG: cell division protein ZapA [Alphaproteobacteria bacterium]